MITQNDISRKTRSKRFLWSAAAVWCVAFIALLTGYPNLSLAINAVTLLLVIASIALSKGWIK